jgi:hypothetical protein
VAVAVAALLLTGAPASADPSPAPPANDLQITVQVQSEAVRQAQAELTVSTQAASVALEAYSLAVQAQQRARAEQQRRQNALGQVEAALTSRRAALGRWARQAYYGGSDLASNPTLTALLSDQPTDDVSHSHRWLAIAGDAQGQAVTGFEQVVAAQEEAARAAEQATAASESALIAAQAAKKTRDDAVQEQRVTLTRLQSRLQTTIDAAAEAERRARLLAEARDIVATQRGRSGDNRITGVVGSCTGGEMQLYANGGIPISALCPLWGTEGDYLRADAAFAFDKLSTAYAQQFGRPLCVTDSYRSYAEQVAVKAEKPDLAATPGTSNHGWGTALDLCGGVQSFDSAQHQWMQLNAPGFGWFHPSWAARTGSKPEPWHWEFGG